MEPKVSVIIPVYNVEKFLQPCIDSLVNQTLEDIELIFVNDASPDNCLQILEENQKKYPGKIKIINSKENLRQGGARNLGIKASRAQYVGFVDGDDFVDKNMYYKMYERICETGADVCFIQYAAVREDAELISMEKETMQSAVVWDQQLLRWDDVELTTQGHKDLIRYPISGMVGGLWKKSIFEENDIWFPEKIRYEDNYLGTLIMGYLNKVTFIDEVYYYYRQNMMSTVHLKNAPHHLERMIIENMLLEQVKMRNLFDKYKEAYEYIYIKRYFINTFNILIKSFDNPPVLKLKQIQRDLKSNFPLWKKNEYFEKGNLKEKVKGLLFMLPVPLVVTLFKIKEKMRKI